MRKHTNTHTRVQFALCLGGVAAVLLRLCAMCVCMCVLMFVGRVHAEPQRSSTQVYKIMKQLAPFHSRARAQTQLDSAHIHDCGGI